MWILWRWIERFALNCRPFVSHGFALKTLIEKLLAQAMAALPETQVPADARNLSVEVENTRDPQHGDFASNLAMRLAKATRQNPRKLAEALILLLPPSAAVAKVEVAGAGFINFFLSKDAYHAEIGKVLKEGSRYGRSLIGAGRSVQVEFVSANPTGPLHVGHGRHAAFGASLANLLRATGHSVHREFYINDGGRQMDILALSTWLRYLERCGESLPYPSNAYRGDYVDAIAGELERRRGGELQRPVAQLMVDLPPDFPAGDKDQYIDALIGRMRALLGAEGFAAVLEVALAVMLADMREDLAEFGVEFDRWYSERELSASGAVEHALERLEQRGALYRKD